MEHDKFILIPSVEIDLKLLEIDWQARLNTIRSQWKISTNKPSKLPLTTEVPKENKKNN